MRHIPYTSSALRYGRATRLAMVAGLLALPHVVLSAQSSVSTAADRDSSRELQLSFGGGFAKVSSSPLSPTNQGYSLQAALGVRTPLRPLRLQVEGLFSEAGVTRIGALTATALVSSPLSWKARPYLVAGGGGYREYGTSLTAGFNLGVGANIRVGGQTVFMESRFHAYRDALAGQPYTVPNGVVDRRHDSQRYLWHPLSFGFRF